MKLRSLRMVDHFLAACRAGSFHGAARETGVTQTAITKSIRELEKTLNVALFDRSVQGVRLTIFGAQFHRRAIQIERHSDFLERELAEMTKGQAGLLRVGAGTVWLDVFLPRVLAAFCTARPHADIVIRRSVGRRFKRQLEEGEIDAGLGLEPAPDDLSPDLVFEPILEVGTRFLVRQGHPLTQRKDCRLEDVAGFSWAMYRLDKIIFDQVRHMIRPHGAAGGEMLRDPSYLADSGTSVMHFVAQTDHVTCLPAPILPLARQFGLTALDTIKGPSFISGATYMAAAADYPLMREFLRALRAFSASQNPGTEEGD